MVQTTKMRTNQLRLKNRSLLSFKLVKSSISWVKRANPTQLSASGFKMPSLTMTTQRRLFTTRLKPSHFSSALKVSSQGKLTKLWKVFLPIQRWPLLVTTFSGIWSTRTPKLSESQIPKNFKKPLTLKSPKNGWARSSQTTSPWKERTYQLTPSECLKWWVHLQQLKTNHKKHCNLS